MHSLNLDAWNILFFELQKVLIAKDMRFASDTVRTQYILHTV